MGSEMCIRDRTEAEHYYKERHEHVRKDIERAFGIIVKQFGILDRPLRNWYIDDIKDILGTCIILHNMIVEKRKASYRLTDLRDIDEEEDEEEFPQNITLFSFTNEEGDANNVGDANDENAAIANAAIAGRIARLSELVENSSHLHDGLQQDLTHHLYNVYRQGRRANN